MFGTGLKSYPLDDVLGLLEGQFDSLLSPLLHVRHRLVDFDLVSSLVFPLPRIHGRIRSDWTNELPLVAFTRRIRAPTL